MKLEDLKNLVRAKAQPLAAKISEAWPFKEIKYYWTRRDTLGFVLTDFEYETGKSESAHKKLIGKGEKDLYKNIRDDYVCLVLSRTQDKNFRELNIGSDKALVVNIDYFKEFLNIIRNSKNTVKLFLHKLEKQHEEFIRGWLRNSTMFQEIMKEAHIPDIDAIIDLIINKYNIDKAADLEKLITLGKATGKKIESNYQYFEKKLNEFKLKIDENVDETQIRDFIYNNIWLLDFQYMTFSKEKEEKVPTGEIDISLLKDTYGMGQAVVVELKKSSKPVMTDKYRGIDKPVIRAEVGKAVSQTIHYIERTKKGYRQPRGIIIIGRETGMEEDFLDTFNNYLHGIEVLTYDRIYRKTKEVIDVFKSSQQKPSTDIVPVRKPQELTNHS